MKTKNQLLGILLVLLTVLILLIFYFVFKPLNLNNLPLNILFYSLGKLAGLIGFLFLSILIISGDTARFFDRFFGINNIILFQRKFAVITFLFVLLHPIFFIISSKSIFPYIIPDFSVIPLALGIVSFYFFVIVTTSSALYKRISYKTWQYLHVLTYLLFFFSLYHATKIGGDYNYFPIKIIYLTFAILIVIGIIYRTNYKIKQPLSKYYVKEIKKETEDTFTLVLETNHKFSFKPGQFCFLRLNKKGIYARHPFTISSSPDEKDLKFTIKLKGRFTQEILNLKKGAEVFIDGPFGIFTLEDTIGKDENKNLVFIAGGVGITPFYSMIKHNLLSKNKREIFLFYCSKTLKEIIFKKEIDKISENWFKKAYILSRDECQGYEKGRINKETITKHLKDIDNSLFFICGPEKMKDCAIKELKELGVKKENIQTESFFW